MTLPKSPTGTSKAEAIKVVMTDGENLYNSNTKLSDVGGSGGLTEHGEQATTSGTTIDFNSIPSTARILTIGFNRVSTNGSSAVIVYLGDASSFETTGYVGMNSKVLTATPQLSALGSTGIEIISSGFAATDLVAGTLTIINVGEFIWSFSGITSISAEVHSVAGSKTLTGALTRVRLTTASADTFDAGSVNLYYQ